jgi:hypothetical protein
VKGWSDGWHGFARRVWKPTFAGRCAAVRNRKNAHHARAVPKIFIQARASAVKAAKRLLCGAWGRWGPIGPDRVFVSLCAACVSLSGTQKTRTPQALLEFVSLCVTLEEELKKERETTHRHACGTSSPRDLTREATQRHILEKSRLTI